MTREYRNPGDRARATARMWASVISKTTPKRVPPAKLAAMLHRAADMFAKRGPEWQLHAESLRRRAHEIQETHHDQRP